MDLISLLISGLCMSRHVLWHTERRIIWLAFILQCWITALGWKLRSWGGHQAHLPPQCNVTGSRLAIMPASQSDEALCRVWGPTGDKVTIS